MTNVTSISTAEGNATINSDEFSEFYRRFKAAQAEIDANKETIKEIIAEAADATKLKKGKVAKYFKSRYDFATKDVKQLGELFESLDNALDN